MAYIKTIGTAGTPRRGNEMNIHFHMTNGADALVDEFGADVPADQVEARCLAVAREAMDVGSDDEDWSGWRVEAWSDDGKDLIANVPFPV